MLNLTYFLYIVEKKEKIRKGEKEGEKVKKERKRETLEKETLKEERS